MVLSRNFSLNSSKSYLLLGPRRVGKSTFLRQNLPHSEYIDLLKNDVFYDYQKSPSLLREQFEKSSQTIVIDEIQKIPELISEVHWLLENSQARFVLSGSSARKLRKQGLTNLAGRLRTQRVVPLTFLECRENFSLHNRLQFGMLPPVYFSSEPKIELKDYCGEYLKEEIQAEGLVRNLPAFSRFLECAAISNTELVNLTNISRDCGVSSKSAAEYFQILEDTLLGYHLEPYTKSKSRRAIHARKFYFFDCGIANTLLQRTLSPKTPEYGKVFEQFIFLETMASMFYNKKVEKLNFWRSSSGFEVDLILNNEIAVEIKSGNVHHSDVKGLNALEEEMPLRQKWIVSTESHVRQLGNNCFSVPWEKYLENIWGEFGSF